MNIWVLYNSHKKKTN